MTNRECDQCGDEYAAGDGCDELYCSRPCRRGAAALLLTDVRTDWLSVRIRQSIVRDAKSARAEPRVEIQLAPEFFDNLV